MRSVNGQPDLELRAVRGGFDERVVCARGGAPRRGVGQPRAGGADAGAGTRRHAQGLAYRGRGCAGGRRRGPGADAGAAGGRQPVCRVCAGHGFPECCCTRFAGECVDWFPAKRIGRPAAVGLQLRAVQVGGTVAVGGGPLAVMDIGAAQDLFGRGGQLSRIDVRLAPGADRSAVLQALALPADVAATALPVTRRSA